VASLANIFAVFWNSHPRQAIPFSRGVFSAADENAVLQSNTELPVRLAKWARSVGYGRFVFFSSVLVWGDHQEEINAQNDLPQPSSLYGRAKIEAEEQLLKLETPSFRVTVLRLPLVYGPGVRGNLARLIDFVNAWPIFPIGSRTALRSLCSIETVCRFVNHILINSLDGVFTITDIELSTYDIARYLAGGLEKPRLVVPTPVVVQQLLRLVAPNTGRKLYGTKVIYGGGTAQVGFNHHLNHEQVKSAFTEMVRHHLGIEKNSSCEGSA